jgi:hypothetical protein
MSLRLLSVLLAALFLGWGCGSEGSGSGAMDDAGASSDAGISDGQVPTDGGDIGSVGDMSSTDGGMAETPTTAEVFAGLSPACVACHGANTQDPYFATLENFERLLVNNPEYVRGGEPNQSELVQLLKGTGTGTFTQMPPFDESFALLEAAGSTDITVAAVERWIASLPPVEIEPVDCSQARPVRSPLRRLTSTEYKFAVQDLLGINIDPTVGFPAEEEALGFDNNADALNVTRLLAEKYFEAGEAAAEAALATPLELLEHVGLPCRNARLDCVRDLAQALARQAYRRPLAPGELDRLLLLFDVGQAQLGDFLEGVKLVIAGILQSPHFLYRIEFGEAPLEGGTAMRLTDHEMAARLSFFLWASMPDAELFAAADRGELRTRAQVEAQARRMVDDPKAARAVRHFYTQWLGLSALPDTEKAADQFPDWTPDIARAMVSEVAAMAQHLTWRQDAGIDDLFSSTTTVLNGPLAAFYGIDGIQGDEPRPVELDPVERTGIMTRGGVLAAHAKANQGSPILRGVFVRERILCQQLPNPPDNVDNSPPELDANATTRERFAAHTEIASCAACHRLIDPIGFAFETFDAVGRYRTMENGQPIDTSGELVDADELDGTYAGAREMSEAFAGNDDVRRCVIRQWFRYTNGRVETAEDVCSIDQVWTQVAPENFSLKELLVAMTQTDAFMYRPAEGGE